MVLASGVALSLGMGLASSSVDAANFTVTNLNDDGAGSLRQAIVDANGLVGTDTIRFQEGLTGTITLTTGQLAITDSLDLEDPGATITVSGNNASRVFYIYSSLAEIDVSISGLTITGGNADSGAGIINFNENLTLDGVTITNNTATNYGGGLWASGLLMDLTIRNSTISGNTAGSSGGGIYVDDTGGPLLIQNTVISGNTATSGAGGGVYLYDPDNDTTIENSTISGNSSQEGGGIFLYVAEGGTHTIRRTTISGNTTESGGGGAFFSAPYANPVVMENSTISGNTVTACDGGGVFFGYTTASTVRHTTVANNSATGSGGGMVVQAGSVTVEHTIVADNTVGGVDNDLGTPLFPGGSFAVSFSLIESPATITDNGGNVLGQDPQLGKLANNGGPTLTHLPANGSPAVNTGDPSIASPPSTDQRGLTRVVGPAIDMGSVETVVVPVTLQGFEVE
jgi:parallel beta-helix repeat protein